jgi:hypothetical protein
LDLREILLEGVVGFIWLKIGTGGLCGNGPVGSIKDGEFLDYLSVLLALQEGLCSMELVITYISVLLIIYKQI